jgi:putative DNA primase/helicase
MMEEQFRQAMQSAGIEPPAAIIADGTLHRFTVPGDKARSANGFYVLYSDGIPAGQFGCFKRGINEPWSSREYQTLTTEEKAAYKRNMEAAKAAREADLQKKQAECREKSTELWEKGREVDAAHRYIVKKGIRPTGIKQLNDMLMIPIRIDGTLTGLQFIQADGAKRFKSGTEITGGYFSIGTPKNKRLIICEGYATGSSLHQATGHAVAVCFTAGNLKAVAEKLRAKYPDFILILCADNDHATEGNPGLTYATQAARIVNGLLAVPSFTDPKGRTDFNDMHQEQGLEAVNQIIQNAQPVAAEQAATNRPSTTITPEPEPEPEAITEGGAWPEPLLFGEIVTPEIPAELLPGWLGLFSKAVASTTQTPPGLSVMFALSAVATCLQNKVEVAPYGDDYREPVNVWTVTALDPGNRKTSVKNSFTAPLTLWESEQAKRLTPEIKKAEHHRDINLKAIEALKLKAAKPDADRKEILRQISEIEEETPDEIIRPRLYADDVTPERLQGLLAEHKGRMALLSDEGGIFEIMAGLYSGGKVNMNVFLQAHAGSSIRVNRQGRDIDIPRPALTFGLAVQPDVIGELATGNKTRFRGNGTLARFLFCLPTSTIGSRDMKNRSTIPESVKAGYTAGVMSLLEIEPVQDEQGSEQARLLTLTPAALEAWQAFSQYIEDRQGPDGEYYSFQDWTSKLPGAALRIAGLFHVVEHGAAVQQINKQTIEKALDLAELLISHARAAFDLMGDDPAAQDAKHIYKWLLSTRPAHFRQTEIYKNLRRFNDAERVTRAMKVLSARHITSEPIKRGSTGRPAILFEVNPAIYETTPA